MDGYKTELLPLYITKIREHLLEERISRRYARGTGGGSPGEIILQIDGDLITVDPSDTVGAVPLRGPQSTVRSEGVTIHSVVPIEYRQVSQAGRCILSNLFKFSIVSVHNKVKLLLYVLKFLNCCNYIFCLQISLFVYRG